MGKIIITVETDPSTARQLLRDPIPGVSILHPRETSTGRRGELLGFITNVEVNLVVDLSLSTVAAIVAYLVGRLHGARNAKLHLNQRTIPVDKPELIQAELNKLVQHQHQNNLPKES